MFEIINDIGRRFGVKLVRKGERYGRNGCLTHDGEHGPLVEFYDLDQDPERFPGGQFVSRYNADVLLGTSEFSFNGPLGSRGGLDLLGDVAEWELDQVAAVATYRWLQRECAKEG